MKHLKRFNESSEEKLYWEIPFDDEYYNDLPTVDFNRNYAKTIVDNLSSGWSILFKKKTGKLLRHSGVWLDLNTNSGDKCVSIFQTDDDYFICDYVSGPDDDDMKIYQCDTLDGLLQFLKSEDIIV
jgi:hypothetical protein